MDNSEMRMVSRRQWVGAVSAAGAAAALGAMPRGTFAQTTATAPGEQPVAIPEARDLGTRIYNIRDFGAKGDGKTLDSAAVQGAIDACTKDQGGTVLVPAGVFVIGTIELKSNVTLHVASAGKLLGSPDAAQYHAAEGIPTSGDTTLGDGNWALIYGINATNVTVEGPGMIDGGGAPPEGITGRRRPYALLFYRCKNLAVRNIDLFRCPYHMVRVIQSAYILMDGIHIYNRVSGNDDGFHFVSCEYVNITNCNVQCQDDACALFGSCKFVMVSNCSFSTRWSVFRFGGGVTENITVSNCVFSHVYGCPIKFQGDPGSHFENISFSNLVLQDVTGPISISISSPADMAVPTEPPLPDVAQPAQPVRRQGPVTARNISFSNIHGTVTTTPQQLPDYPRPSRYNDGEKMSCIVLNCLGSAVMENISFNDINLTFGGGGTAEVAANRKVPEVAGEYFRLGPMPAFGLYARNVKGLTLQNVRFQVSSPELRPAIIFDHIEDAAINGLSVEGNAEAESVLRLIDSKDALLSAARLTTPASVFIAVEGAEGKNIKVDGGDFSKAKTPFTFDRGAASSMLKVSE